MNNNDLLYCLVAFILGWLVSRMMGNGFSVGAQNPAPTCRAAFTSVCSGPFTPTETCDVCAGLNQHKLMEARCSESDLTELCFEYNHPTPTPPPPCSRPDAPGQKDSDCCARLTCGTSTVGPGTTKRCH